MIFSKLFAVVLGITEARARYKKTKIDMIQDDPAALRNCFVVYDSEIMLYCLNWSNKKYYGKSLLTSFHWKFSQSQTVFEIRFRSWLLFTQRTTSILSPLSSLKLTYAWYGWRGRWLNTGRNIPPLRAIEQHPVSMSSLIVTEKIWLKRCWSIGFF